MISRATSVLARRSALLLLAAASVLAACAKEGKAAKKLVSRRYKHAAVWAPATLTNVQGVPIADLKAAIATRLAAKAPENVDDDAWHHTQALYKSLGETPLWLTTDGLAKDRAGALTAAVLSISDDALRVDAYPITDLSNALVAIKQTTKPTAEQLANADVLLSSVYASLGEDLLVGQIPPKAVGQSWHIDPTEDDVDSALVHSLGDTLERGIAEMRPPDADYAALQKELTAIAESSRRATGRASHPERRCTPGRLIRPSVSRRSARACPWRDCMSAPRAHHRLTAVAPPQPRRRRAACTTRRSPRRSAASRSATQSRWTRT